MVNDLIIQKAGPGAESAHETCRSSLQFEDLPLDVVYTILSKLPPKEFARASVLSSKWRGVWEMCPRLTFDGLALCKCNRENLHQRTRDVQLHTRAFVHEVNGALRKHNGKVVETLEVRIELLDDQLVHHLDNLVRFAAASRTKSLTLDLKPKWFLWDYKDRYEFPFECLDRGSVSCLQHMQLSFVSMKPPAEFRGFPNLRKLHLQLLHVSRKDLEYMLSRCSSLEWLHLDRCDLNDELKVDAPLSHLLYLHVDYCRLTKIEFHAVNLTTFVYEGSLIIPIDLTDSSKLQSANITLGSADFQQAFAALLNGLPDVQNLTLKMGLLLHPEKQWLWDNQLKFPYLRHLQLILFIFPKDVEKVLYYSLSFLRTAPFIEKLEVHFSGSPSLWLADVGPRKHDLQQCKYGFLKNFSITGFKAATGQLEFLLHVVGNAPVLEVVTVDTKQWCKDLWRHGGSGPPFEEARRSAITCLSKVLPENVKLNVH